MRKIYTLFVLLILLVSMMPAVNADPDDDSKIKVAYVNSDGSIESLYNAAAQDDIVKKYVSAAELIVLKDSDLGEDLNIDLSDYDFIILEHLTVVVIGALEATLTEASDNGASIISMTQTSAAYENIEDVTSKNITVEGIKKYMTYPSEGNYKNLFLTLALYNGLSVSETIAAAVETDVYGIYHPDSDIVFSNASEYMEWYTTREDGGHVFDPNMPTIGVIPSSVMNKTERDSPVWDAFVESIEGRGYNVVVGTYIYGARTAINETANRDNFMIDDEVIVDSIIAISRGGRFFSTSSDMGRMELENLGVPVLNAIQLYDTSLTIDSWREMNDGVIAGELYQLAFAEQDGIIEPIVVAVKDDGSTNTPIPEQIEWMTERAIGWAVLGAKSNEDKKIVIPYYAADAGKSNVGSDPDYYLNAPESILNLLKAMEEAGYDVGDLPDTADELKDILVEYGYNVGTWAPGELEKRAEKGNVTLLPVDEYAAYFEMLPAEKQAEVKDLWGESPGDIMVYKSDGEQYFVIPTIQFGNVMLTPQPLRGRDQSENALNHVGSYPPTHQALAVYYYINEVYEADALLPVWSNLGVMPGNQASLAADDWTALMIQDLPHIHMLPMDATGITDKRRANMLVIDFLTPYLMPSGLYGELSELESLIYDYEQFGDEEVKSQTIELIKETCESLGLDTSLNLNWENTDTSVSKIKSHLSGIKSSYIPYGDHVLGVAPTEDQIYSMTSSMLSYNTFDVKINSVDFNLNLDDLLEEKFGSEAESIKEELLDEIFEGNTVADAVLNVTGSRDSHIEYTLAMAIIYKLGLGNEIPTDEQIFSLADTLLSFDVYIQTATSTYYYRNLDDELYQLYDEDADEMKKELIINTIVNGEDPEETIRNLFGDSAYSTVSSDTKLTYGEDVERVLMIVNDQIDKLKNPTNEIESLLNALDAKYIPTGQTGDPIQNFEAVPTGRNPVQDDSRLIPTKAAYAIGQKLADTLILTYQENNSDAYPEKVAFLLWAVEAARTGGTSEGEIFSLLGVEPNWDANGRINNSTPLKLISAEELGRPRIDVVVETSGSYRDSYSRQILWINQAVRMAAEAPDSDEYPNYVKRNSDAIYEALKEEYKDSNLYTDDELRELSYARVFGPPEGEYTRELKILQAVVLKMKSTLLNFTFSVWALYTAWKSAVKLFGAFLCRVCCKVI
ncbi:Aerobic cobaltochelatase subunit CobN [Methanimicrococcus hongohii]|uniref:Aerobic cobaltochelatase subunit CobN n=1 Tax=Methanimicrococcus hongohii TaxID=3028295 RepID=A0AA96V307_9EURY|nr:cobaltochelatase subunit CobN [Methanimicrococcus sp. Hf6]WNY24450.1 Aerobic cobaltochelatase subunit CobN [Methanimicrococcus sp. Hf6]